MLAKEYRLKKERDFKRIFKEGKIIRGQALSLATAENGLNISRFGFVAGLKVSKKATVRNRLKRQSSEAIKVIFKDIKPGYDAAIILNASAAEKKYGKIFEELKGAIKKAGLFTS